MKKSTLLTAAALVLIGCALFAAVMSGLGWDVTKLSTVNYETNTHEINQTFDRISVDTDTADIRFVRSADGTCTVVCHEAEKANHSVAVNDGTLTICLVDERAAADFVGINLGSTAITISLPEAEYISLKIRDDTGDVEIPKDFTFQTVNISLRTGDIRMEQVSADELDISVSTGKVQLTEVACRCMTARGSTGDISLERVIATEMLSIATNTGDVKFTGCDAAEIYVETDTGDVTGNLLSDKVFVTQTDTGRVDVPRTATGGRCEITTDTGDIKIRIG